MRSALLFFVLCLALLLFAPPAAAQWQPVAPPLQGYSSDAMVSGPGFIAVYQTDNTVYTSRDGGATWTSTGLRSPIVTEPYVLFSRVHDGHVYALLDDVGGSRWGFYRTADGLTWTRLNGLAQAEHRRTPVWHKGVLYATDSNPPGLFALSADGSTWTQVGADFTSDATWANLLGSAGGRLYLTTSNRGAVGVQYSEDGVTWHPSSDSLSSVLQVGQAALSIASPPRFSFSIVGGVFKGEMLAARRSVDGGRAWRSFAMPPRAGGESELVTQFLPVGGDRVIASNAVWGEFWASEDAGATWQRLPDPLGTNLTTGMMATDGQYVFIWDKKNDQFLRRPIASFFPANTEAEGVELPVPPALALEGAHPVRGAARLRVRGTGMLAAYDALGRLVYRQHVTDGVVTLDVAAWPAGVYALHLDAAGQTATRLLVVTR